MSRIKRKLTEAVENGLIRNMPVKLKYWIFMSVFAEVWKDTNADAAEMKTLDTIDYYGKKHETCQMPVSIQKP